MTRKFIRIVGTSEYTRRVYVEVDGSYSIFDYEDYTWKPNLVPITQEEVLIEQTYANLMELGKAAKKLVPLGWKGGDS